MKKLFAIIFLIAASLSCVFAADRGRKSVAVFVRNDSSDPALDSTLKTVANLVSASINNAGFAVVDSDLALKNLDAYTGAGKAEAEKIAKSPVRAQTPDETLLKNVSGLRLAQMFGADYVLAVSLSNFAKNSNTSNLYGVRTQNNIYTLSCNYNLYEAGEGLGAAGGVAKSRKVVRRTQDSSSTVDVMGELVEDCAGQIAESLVARESAGAVAAKKGGAGEVVLQVRAGTAEFPRLSENPDGTYALSVVKIPLELAVFSAEIDGVSQSVVDGKLRLAKGIHFVKIAHKDLEPIEKTINITGESGQQIVFDAQMTEAAKARMRSDMQWFQQFARRQGLIKHEGDMLDAEVGAKVKLTDAEAAKIGAIGEMLKNSGYKMDVKVDSKNLPEINKVQSVFGQ